MKNRLNNPLSYVSGVVLFLMTFSVNLFGQTPSYSPTPVSGIVYVCEGGEVTLTVNGTTPGEQYSMNANPPSGTQTLTATGTSLTFAPVLYSTSGAYSISLIRIFPLMFFPNQTIQVLVDPTVAVLTLSDPEGNVEAGTLISATVGTAGTGGAPGSIDEFEYSKDGGTTWLPYTLGDNISTTDFMLSTVKIKSIRRHPDGLGCYSENIYTWNIDSRVHDITGTQGSYYHIQQAIDAASTVDGDVLEIEAGTMALPSVVNINKEITLKGQGIASTIIDISSSWFTNPSVNAFTLNDNNITIEDIYFRIVGKGQGNIIGLFQSNCTVQDNKFTGEYVYGDGEVTRATVWSANNMTGLLFNNNIIESLRQPGYLSNGSGTISNNTITTTRGWVIEGVGTMSFTGNTFGANTSHITILDVAANISGLSISNNDLSGTVVDWKIDNRAVGVLDADCNWYGSASYASVFAGIKGKVAFVPYKPTSGGMCNVGFSMPDNLVLTHTQASESILVQFDVTDNDLELKPIPGLNPNVPAELAQIAALYAALEAAVLGGNPSAIQAAALAVGDDIITEYYYMDGVNKIYLQTAGGNNLIKNKYWQEYLVRSSDTERFPDWLNNLTLVNQEEFRTSTNPLTGAVAAGWLNPVLGRDVIIKVTFIHNGAVNSIEEIVSIPPGPIENLNTGLGYPTIQAAINAANTNDRIGVATGSYTENVDATTKTISLVPGNSPGCVTITGDFTLNAMNTLEMEVDGTTACTDYDQFVINGVVTLGGATLNLDLGYAPTLGDSYVLISNDGVDPVVGQFAQGFSISQGGNVFDITYTGGDGNDVVLTKCTGGVVNVNTAKEFCSIQDAIDDNSTVGGHTLSVLPGIYNISSTINVNKSLTINGPKAGIDPRTSAGLRTPDDPSEAVVNGGGSIASIFYISASNVVINGLQIKNGTGDLITSPDDYPLTSRDIEVKYCIVNGSNTPGDEGIQLYNLDGGGVEYCRIFDVAQDAINLAEGTTNSFIRFNEIYQSSSSNGAIYLYDNRAYNSITDNYLYNNAATNGITIGRLDGANNNSNSSETNNAEVLRNVVTGNGNTNNVGIYINTSRVKVNENVVTNCGSTADAALYLRYNIKDIEATGNIIHNNYRGVKISSGVAAINTPTLVILNNSFDTNTDLHIQNGSSGTLIATCNWLGSTDLGLNTSKVSGPVTFVPWLSSGLDASPGTTGFQPSGSCGTAVQIDNVAATDIFCGPTIGSVEITFSGGSNPINIGWNGGSSVNVTSPYIISPLAAGTYNITVSSANGTTAVTSATVEYLPVLNTMMSSYHPTIQAAVNAANPGDPIEVCAGTYLEDVLIPSGKNGLNIYGLDQQNTIVSGPVGGGNATFRVESSGVIIDGFTITREGNNLTDWDNPGLNSVGVSVQGQTASAIIQNNIITGNRTGIDINNSNGNQILTNEIDFNRTGLIFRNQTDNTIMTGNYISNNWTAGVLFLDASGGSNSPVQSAANSNFNENFIVGNWYGDIVDRQSGGSLPVPGSNLKNFECNWFGVNLPVVSTANSTEPGYSALIPVLYGGSATNPGGAPNILGPASANIDYINWGLDADDNDMVTLGWQITPGTCTGSPVEIDMVTLSPNQFCQENGSIEVAFSGGSANYSITWEGAETGTQTGIMASPYTITNLIHGSYSITITDANGSSANSAVFINNHPVRNTTLTQYYPTIQAAIDAAANGHIIDVCAGMYTESINVNKAITLQGANVGTAGNGVRVVESTLLNCDITYSSGGNITLDGFKLLRTDAFAGNQLLLNAGGLNTVQNCLFERNGSVTGTVVRAISTGTSGGNKVISNNKFTGDASNLFGSHKTWNNGVYVDQGSFTTMVSNNLFENSRTALNIDDHSINNTVLNNTFTNNGTHISFGGAVPTTGTHIFGANNFNTSGSAIINLSNVNTNFRLDITSSSYNGTPCASLSNAQLFEMEAQMFHKERSGRKGKVVYRANNQYVNNITVPFVKLDVIQNSVSYGDPNDIINLQAGTYNQRVVIDRNDLTVQGVTTDKTLYILDGSTGVVGTGSGITLNNNITGTSIQNITVQNFAGDGGNTHAGIRGMLSNSITNVNNVAVLNNSNSSGIFFGGGAAINQVSVTNSMVTGHVNGARGIVIWDGLKTNINFSNNMVTNNSCCGIELQDGDASGVNVSNNTIDVGTGDNAIGLVGLNPSVGANLINGNMISGGGRFGIEIKNPAGGVTVSNNNVSLTTINADLRDRAGIAVFRRSITGSNINVPNGVTITGNTVTGYTQTLPEEGFGIVIEGTNHTVSGNTVNNCNIGIQEQGGAHPNANYPLNDGDQNVNMSANYFGRGNAPFACGNTISTNTFSGNGTDTRTVVMNSFGLVTNTTSGEYFCNIQAAINDVQTLAGHTLTVAAGSYPEAITVNKSLTLRGPNYALTPCVDTRLPEAVITGGLNVANGSSLTVVVEGFHFQGVTTPLSYNGNVGSATLTATFNNNLVNASSGQLAVFVGNPTNSAIFNANNNCFQNMTGNAMQIGGGDFETTIDNNIINTTGFAGINADAIKNSAISNNTISNTGQQGIQLAGVSNNVNITSNVITNCNTSAGADRGGIRLRGTNYSGPVTVSYNSITGSLNGVAVANGENITGKTINVNNNNLEGNTSSVYHGGTGSLNAECNWHGSANYGTILAQLAGTGSTNIDVISWLVNGTDDQPATFGFQPVSGSCSGTPVVITNVTTTPVLCGPTNGDISVTFGGGTGPYTVSWSGAASGGPVAATSVHTITPLPAGLYTVVVTDNNGSSASQAVTIDYLPVTNSSDMPNTHYATIQSAIDAVTTTDGEVILVCAGTYAENIKVTKQVSILGPNAAVDACSGTRNPEAVIYTSASDIDFDTDNGTLIEVLASNVTIAGLTLDGDNPAITTGKTSTNGADIDVAEGVTRYGTGNNLVITNNIIKNLSYFGITMYDFPTAVPSAGNSISGNLIKDLGTYDNTVDLSYWGNGILLYNNQYASVVNNCMENVRGGIQTGNFYQANPGAASYQMITGNTIQARRRGIFHNLAYSNASPFTFENNTITGLVNANETVWDGVLIASMSVPSYTLNNTINGTGISNPSEGIEVWNVKNNAPATITGGNVSNVGTGIFLNNFEGYGEDGGDGAHATISNVTINATTTGVRLLDSPSSTSHGKVNATVSNCNITAGVEGIKTEENLTGTTGGTFEDNTIIAGAIGVNITGMTLSPTNALTIDNNNIDLTSQTADLNPTIGVLLSKILGTQNAIITDNTITDAFYGYIGHNINTTPVTSIQGGSITGVMQGVAFFNTLGGPLAASNSGVSGVLMSGFTGSSANPANNIHAGIYSFTAGGTTPATGLNLAINNVTITGTGTPSQASAGIHNADFSGGAVDVQTVTVTNSTISNNANRGIDARGKVNLTMTGNTLTNNGHTAFGTGGNNGFSVIAQQNATVTAQNNFITLPAASATEVFGLITGNGTTNQIIAHNNSILLNGNSDPDTKLAQSLPGTGNINATCNWWGDMVCPADEIAGNVLIYPFLTNGTDDAPATPGFQPVAGSCNEPSISATVTGPDLPPNVINMSSGNVYTMTICSGEEVTTGPPSVVNMQAANCSSLRVQTVYTTTLTNLPPTQTFDADYATASVAPPTSITPENHQTTAQDIVFVSTPYYDVNGNNQYDAGTDVAGGIITFTLTVQPRPSISNTVSSGMYSQVMTSGGSYTHTICHETDITTSIPVMNTSANACGTLRIQTQYISTLPNIPSATVDVSFDDAVLAGPQTISPNNTTGTSQTITFITTPYYDVNGNMMYDVGLDVVGDVTNFVLTILPIPEGEISGTTFVIQNAPTTANVIFTGSVGTAPYTFTYHINGGPVQSVSTTGMNNVVTVPHPNGTPGVFVYTLLSVTDANGCGGEVNPLQNTVTITVIPANMLPDLSPSIARPLNASFTTGQTKEGYVQVTNGGNGPTYGTTKVRLPKTIGNFNLVIDQNAVMSAGQSVVNSQCTFNELLTVWEISFDDPIPNGTNIKIGYTLTGTGLSGSNGTMTSTVINQSGGDSNDSNNRATRRFVIN